MQALTERQPQLEKTKALRARAPLSRKAVAALCVTSFVAGLLLSGRVSLMSADASRDDGAKESVRASGCAGNKRVSVLSVLSLSVAWLLSIFILASDRTLNLLSETRREPSQGSPERGVEDPSSDSVSIPPRIEHCNC